MARIITTVIGNNNNNNSFIELVSDLIDRKLTQRKMRFPYKCHQYQDLCFEKIF